MGDCCKGGTVYPHGIIVVGVALLPFVDEKRLRKALEDVYPDLTADES